MAGLTLTITGLVAAVSSPVLVSMLGRADRRTALCALVAVLVLGNVGAAWAPDFGTMVAARVLVGIGMGGVWAVAAGLAVRLVPAKSVGPATSLGALAGGLAADGIGTTAVMGVGGALAAGALLATAAGRAPAAAGP